MPGGSEEAREPKSKKELVLKVMEAKQKDAGRGKVRIDVDMLNQISCSPGDIVDRRN